MEKSEFYSKEEIQEAKRLLPLVDLMDRLDLGAYAERSARCPFHNDGRNSFSVYEQDGEWRWKCHAGCGGGDQIDLLAKARGLDPGEAIRQFCDMAIAASGDDGETETELQDEEPDEQPPPPQLSPQPQEQAKAPTAKPKMAGQLKRVAARYDYVGEHGTLLFQVVRFEPKDFRVRVPDGKGGWLWGMNEARRVLYHLPDVLKAAEVWIAEGEKDADNTTALGFVATTSPSGAGKWREEYNEALKGKTVLIVPDNDEPGMKHANAVAKSLRGVAASVKIVTLPKTVKDVSDYIATFKVGADAAKQLRVLADSSPPFDPSTVKEGPGSGPRPATRILTATDHILKPGINFCVDMGVVTVSVHTETKTQHGASVQWSPLAVTSNGEMELVSGNTVVLGKREFIFTSRPMASPPLARWGYEDIQRFCKEKCVDPAKVFNQVLELHRKYLDYRDEGAAITLTLWCIGTYFYVLFPAYPYVELNGPKGSGKSKQARLTALLAFNGKLIADPTEATTFRMIEETRGTLCFDEAETFDKEQKAVLLQILNMGYTAGGTVMRCEDRTHAIREFEIYSPKMFASIRGIDSTTATRCIRFQCLRTKDRTRGNLDITEHGEDWAGIRHGLYSLALTEFKAVRETYLKEDVRPFANRDNEKWAPILTLARFFEARGVGGLYERVLAFARGVVEESVESGLAPFDEAVLVTLHKLTEFEPEMEVVAAELLDAVRTQTAETWDRHTPQHVGYALRRIGFKRAASRRKGSCYRVTRAMIVDVAERYDVDLGETEDEGVQQPAPAPVAEKAATEKSCHQSCHREKELKHA